MVALDMAGAFDRVWQARFLEKFGVTRIQRHLMLVLDDYLRGKTFHVIVNVQSSEHSQV